MSVIRLDNKAGPNNAAVEVGDIVEVELEGTGGGYLWVPDGVIDAFEVVYDGYIGVGESIYMDEAAGQVFRLRATEPGEHTVTFIHQRPWMPDDRSRTAEFNIKVTDR